MMKWLQAFWKLFKRKQKRTDIENLNESDSHEKSLIDSSEKVTDQKTKPSPFIIKPKEKVHIQVGLDFGTSSTKVAFKEYAGRTFRVINFNHGLPNYPAYCIPSIGCIDNNGHLQLGVSAAKSIFNKEWDSGLQRLKVVLAGKYDTSFKDVLTEDKYYSHFKVHKQTPIEPDLLTAVFLAYVIRNSRKIIKNMPEYREREIDLAFNICMPIDHYENNVLKSIFEKVFRWAELIEKECDKSNKNFNLLEAAISLEKSPGNFEPRVFAVPEAVASFASYLISLRKREGLHAIIDLGAGTTDLSICNLFIEKENMRNFWYAARNFPKGTIKIERAFAQLIAQNFKIGKCTSKDICACVEALSSKQQINQSQKNQKLKTIVLKELCNLRDSSEYYRTWGAAYRHQKKDYLWKNVEIFVCGGGSNLPHIDDVFSKPWWVNLKTKYKVSKLPVPDNYDPGSSMAPFERMSVAYGLAIPIPQLGNYTLPGDSPNHTPEPSPDNNPDHEDLYPKD
jgi:hypothetical protein